MTNQKHVELTLHATGYCTHPEWVTLRGGSMRSIRIPAGFARIVHPELGTLLFDTGYAARFFDAASRFPYSIYGRVTPVVHDPSEGAAALLKRQFNLDAGEVNLIILSHFHADHVAGLRDFPNARFIYLPEAYEAVRGLRGLAAVRAGFLPDLMPEDFGLRSSPVPPSARMPLPDGWPFRDGGYDLLGDGSLIGVDISGHATGQMGLLLSTAEHEYFLCADAVWSRQAIRENRPPHPVAGLIMPDRRKYLQSFTRLRLIAERFPHLRIIPSHCGEVWRTLIQRNERL